MTSSTIISVQKITARIFCLPTSRIATTGGKRIIDDGVGILQGGNPVTIFSSPNRRLPESVQRRLAKTCQWESVILTTDNTYNSTSTDDDGNGDGDGDGDGDGTTYTALSTSPSTSVPLLSMSFFMPSGEEVSFCAHAAIGGAMMRQQQEQQQQISNSNHNKKQLSTTETITTNYFYSLIFQAAMTGEYFKVDVINNNDEDREDDNDVDKDHDKEDDSTR